MARHSAKIAHPFPQVGAFVRKYIYSFLSSCHSDFREGWSGGNMGLRPLGPKEIYGEPVPPGKAYTLLTDHLTTGKPLWFEPAQQKVFKSNHLYI